MKAIRTALLLPLVCLSLCSCSITLGIPLRRMPSGLGQNLWNIGWGNNWRDYYKTGIDWTTEKNPWKQAFLDDISHFKGPLRFMDWDVVNFNPIIRWSDRAPKTGNHYDYAYAHGWSIPIDPSIQAYYTEPENADGVYTYWGVAYEWMIDLCNRTGRDMWICVPIFADDDYCRRLAKLIDDSLDPSLKVYLEYANETWNTGFKACQYHMDQAVSMGLPGGEGGALIPEYQGGAYTVLRSLQVFQIFQEVFGDGNTGIDRRLVRCLCSGGNEGFSSQGIQNIIYDGRDAADYAQVPFNATYNPHGQSPDVYALAPYAGGLWDGAAPDAILNFRRDISYWITRLGLFRKMVIDRYHYPLVAYEGGQGVTLNADVFSRNPALYSEYLKYLDTWREQGFIMFVHYALYSKWESGGAWGAKESADSPAEDSPKFRALVDWQASNP